MNSKYVLNSALSLLTFIVIFLDLNGEHHTLMSILILGMNALSIYRVRKNIYLRIIYSILMYCHYCILFRFYLSEPENATALLDMHSELSIQAIIILGIFSLLLLLITPEIKETPPLRLITEDCRDNMYIVAVMVVVILIATFLGHPMPEEGVKLAERPGGWFRNVYTFELLALYYSGGRPKVVRLLVALAVIYCLRSFIAGERLNAFSLILAIYMGLYIKKIKLRYVIPPAILLIMFFNGVVEYRAKLFYMDDALEKILELAWKNKLVVDTPLGGWVAARSALYSLNFTSWGQRLYFFYRGVLTIFLGVNIQDSSITTYAHQFLNNAGGAMFQYCFYFYFGIVGLVVTALYLYFMFRIVKYSQYSNDGYVRCIGIYIASSTIIWYLYSPFQIFRSAGVLAIGYYLLDFAYRLSTKRVPLMRKKITATTA